MSRTSAWYVAAVLLIVAAIASFIGSNTWMGVAAAVLAVCMLVLGTREKGRSSRRTP